MEKEKEKGRKGSWEKKEKRERFKTPDEGRMNIKISFAKGGSSGYSNILKFTSS